MTISVLPQVLNCSLVLNNCNILEYGVILYDYKTNTSTFISIWLTYLHNPDQSWRAPSWFIFVFYRKKWIYIIMLHCYICDQNAYIKYCYIYFTGFRRQNWKFYICFSTYGPLHDFNILFYRIDHSIILRDFHYPVTRWGQRYETYYFIEKRTDIITLLLESTGYTSYWGIKLIYIMRLQCMIFV